MRGSPKTMKVCTKPFPDGKAGPPSDHFGAQVAITPDNRYTETMNTPQQGNWVEEWSAEDHHLYASWMEKLKTKLDPWDEAGYTQWIDTVWDYEILPTNVSEYLATR